MGTSAIARRYAKALLSLAVEEDNIETIGRELEALDDLLTATPELEATLFTPAVNAEAKRNIVAAVLDKLKVSETTANFVGLITLKGRFNSFRDIRAEFSLMADEVTGTIRARLTSAAELPEELQKRIVEKLAGVTGKKIELEQTVDPDLIGGVIAEVGGVVYDASLRTQLRNIRGSHGGHQS